MSIFLKLLQKTQGDRTHLILHYEARVILTPYPDKYYKERKLQTEVSEEHRCQGPQQNVASQIQQHIKKITHHGQVEFILKIQG
jgi:hypothetical protein